MLTVEFGLMTMGLRVGPKKRADLWNGADVEWTSSDSATGVVPAVVVDAGRHHVASFGTLSRGRVRHPRGVRIRLADGQEMDVRAESLRLVAPDLLLQPEPDASKADWWLEQLQPWSRPLCVASFVPRSFEAVGRLLHPWSSRGPIEERRSWAEVADFVGVADRSELVPELDPANSGPRSRVNDAYGAPREGQLDEVSADALVRILGSTTTTPDDVYVAVWEGWGDTPKQRFPEAAHIEVPGRHHFLLRGPLEGLLTPIQAVPVFERPVCGIWWPADHSWFVQSEIDFAWSFVAGDTDLISRLAEDPVLEVIIDDFDGDAIRF